MIFKELILRARYSNQASDNLINKAIDKCGKIAPAQKVTLKITEPIPYIKGTSKKHGTIKINMNVQIKPNISLLEMIRSDQEKSKPYTAGIKKKNYYNSNVNNVNYIDATKMKIKTWIKGH